MGVPVTVAVGMALVEEVTVPTELDVTAAVAVVVWQELIVGVTDPVNGEETVAEFVVVAVADVVEDEVVEEVVEIEIVDEDEAV